MAQTEFVVRISVNESDLTDARIRLGYKGMTDREFISHMAVYSLKHRAGVNASVVSVETAHGTAPGSTNN